MARNEDINVTFSRALLRELMDDVRQYTTAAERKAACTYKFTGGHATWEFHGPNGFYWHGRADNGYDARYKGWSAYLRKLKVEGYTVKGD